MRLRLEDKHMGRVGVCYRRKADPLVKTCRIRVLSAQTYTAEVGASFLDESGHECSANAPAPRTGSLPEHRSDSLSWPIAPPGFR